MSTFKIKKLSIEGFLAYGKRQEIVFPDAPGVYRIDGFNHVEPRQGSNGSGKTDVLRALSWARYGKTHDGMFGPSVKSWSRIKGANMATEVVEEGEKDGVPYTISRMQSPNKVSLNGTIVDQPALDKFLERNYTLFLASTMFPASSQSFLSLGPTAQMDKISAVLGLDAWDERSDVVAKKSTALKKEVVEIESEISRVQATRAVLQTTISEQLTAKRVAQERVEIEKAEDAELIESLIAKMPKLPAKPELVLESPAKQALEEAKEKINAAEKAESQASSALDHRRRNLEDAEKSLRKFEKTPPDTCHACQGVINAELHSTMDAEFRAKVSAARDAVEQASKLHQQRRNHLDGLRSELEALEADARTEEDEQSTLRQEHEAALVSWSKVRTQRKAIKEQIETLREKEYAPFDDRTLSRSEAQLATASRKLEDLEERLVSTQASATNHGLLADCFAKIRIAEMERGCAEFAAYMLGAFDALGLVGYQVDVACAHEAGEKKDPKLEFKVKIKTPCHTDWVPWKSWSDGQQHRLAQAGDTAFSDLAASRCSVVNLDEFWDERTNSLSAQGCVDQMEYLDMRARTKGKVLMVIDHRTGDSPVFQGLLWVDRRKNGSTIGWKTQD